MFGFLAAVQRAPVICNGCYGNQHEHWPAGKLAQQVHTVPRTGQGVGIARITRRNAVQIAAARRRCGDDGEAAGGEQTDTEEQQAEQEADVR